MPRARLARLFPAAPSHGNHWRSLASVVAPAFVILAGCADASPVAEAGDDQQLVPASTKNHYDQAAVCDGIFKRHAGIRELDLKEGVLRWSCGDVNGVTGTDLGQEYCEYKATAGGKVVKAFADIKKNGGKLQCLFTSVYKDVKGYDSPASLNHATGLAADMKDPKNLGAAIDPKAIFMQVGFNSRGAATALIVDCATNATKDLATLQLNEQRQAACYFAGVLKPANVAKLKAACRDRDLSTTKEAKNWAAAEKLGAKVLQPGEADYERYRDIAACLRTQAAAGITWRNSDPMICTRVTRAVNECAVQFNAIPEAYDGFTFSTWTSRKALPSGCRFALVKGLPSPNLVICEASASEIEKIQFKPNQVNDLNEFCKERFSRDLVMEAPLRALQKAGKSEGPFCSTYNSGWKP